MIEKIDSPAISNTNENQEVKQYSIWNGRKIVPILSLAKNLIFPTALLILSEKVFIAYMLVYVARMAALGAIFFASAALDSKEITKNIPSLLMFSQQYPFFFTKFMEYSVHPIRLSFTWSAVYLTAAIAPLHLGIISTIAAVAEEIIKYPFDDMRNV